MTLTWEGWVTLGVITLVFFFLVRNIAPPDVVMFSASVCLGLLGILTTEQVFAGLTSPGVLAIGLLFIVAAGVRESGALDLLGGSLLGKARTERSVLLRMAASIVPLSAFMNNTPVVAMMVPMVTDWSRKHDVSPSRLLIPLSYMAIIGGTCTLIGTATTIVVNDLIREEHARYVALIEESPTAPEAVVAAYEATRDTLLPVGMFEVTLLGLPFAAIGVLYIMLIGRRLLPSRDDMMDTHGASARSYLIDMRVQPECKLAGKSIEDAGLRHLVGLFLVSIEREERQISPVRPDEMLRVGDVLTFTGVVSNIVDLERIQGLVPTADEGYETAANARRDKGLCEAVISTTSPLLGQTVRDADFRAVYNAAIIAVHRGGQRLEGRVGDTVLREGDTLLLQSGPHFLRAHRNNPDFYLVGGVDASEALRNDKTKIALILLLGLVLMMSFGRDLFGISIPIVAATAAALMIGTQCVSPAAARQAVDWRTLLTIAFAISLGRALQETGVAAEIAGFLVESTQVLGPVILPFALLAVVYILTSMLTECVTTQGSAVLMFPIAVAAAVELGMSPRPFAFAVLFAAAASFVTPLGYQTNLMVYGPGGYKFMDYIKVGLPLNIILTATAILLIPQIWPF